MNTKMINEILKRLANRVLLIPVVLVLISGIMQFYAFFNYGIRQSVIVAFVPIAFLLIGISYVMIKKLDLRILFCLLISLVFVSYLTYYYQNSFSVYMNQKVNIGENQENAFTITEIERRFDGSIRYYALNDICGKVIIYNTEELIKNDIKTSDTVLISGKLTIPQEGTNPGEFNNRKYLRNKGIYYILNPSSLVAASSGRNPVLLSSYYVKSFSYTIRYKIYLYFKTIMSSSNAELAGAVFLGDKSELDDDVKRNFKLSNSSHILACSGVHFAAFLLLLPILLEKITRRKNLQILIYSVVAFIFACLTGFGNSVTRAFCMSITRFTRRDSLSGLLFIFTIMVLVEPFVILDSGFQMSFLVCLFIMLFGDNKREENQVLSFLKLSSIALVSILPFLISIDYYVNVLNLLSQLINNGLLMFSCVLIFPCLILSRISSVFIWPIEMLLDVMRNVAYLSSRFSLLTINLRNIYYPIVICVFLGFIVYRLPSIFIKKYLINLVVILTAISVGLSLAEFYLEPSCKVVFADVGQGDSILIMSEKYNALIDGGIYEEGERTLSSLLDYYQIDKIDFAIITHPDSDHGAGIAALYNKGRIKTLYCSYIREDKILPLGFDSMPQIDILKSGYNIKLSNSTSLEVISPNKVYDGENDDSLVIYLRSYSTSILLTGDISSDVEQNLVNKELITKTDILKVSHHGSRYSTSDDFINKLNPNEAIISVGKYNNYGHPSREVIETLERYNVHVYKTSSCGAVIVDIYSHKYEVYGYLDGK